LLCRSAAHYGAICRKTQKAAHQTDNISKLTQTTIANKTLVIAHFASKRRCQQRQQNRLKQHYKKEKKKTNQVNIRRIKCIQQLTTLQYTHNNDNNNTLTVDKKSFGC
jgi:hypothetical protein